jgi:apolipoprotein N-acyltransferase
MAHEGTGYDSRSETRRRLLFECGMLAAAWFFLAWLSWPLLQTGFPLGLIPYGLAALAYPAYILMTPATGLGRHGFHLLAMAAGMGLSLALQGNHLGDGFFLYPVVAGIAAFGSVLGLVALAIRKGRDNAGPPPGGTSSRTGLADL